MQNFQQISISNSTMYKNFMPQTYEKSHDPNIYTIHEKRTILTNTSEALSMGLRNYFVLGSSK